MSFTSLADAKSRLSELVSSAQSTHERTTITKNGRPAAVLVSADDWDSIMATVELLSDPASLADLAESDITGRHGLVYEADDVWDGERTRSAAESERRLAARLGQEAYAAARAAVRDELAVHPDANVRLRGRDYA